jgi:hypothetical protein
MQRRSTAYLPLDDKLGHLGCQVFYPRHAVFNLLRSNVLRCAHPTSVVATGRFVEV